MSDTSLVRCRGSASRHRWSPTSTGLGLYATCALPWGGDQQTLLTSGRTNVRGGDLRMRDYKWFRTREVRLKPDATFGFETVLSD